MTASLLVYEVTGHTAVTLAFVAIVAYVVRSRRILRRSVKRAALLYWIIMILGGLATCLNLIRLLSLVKGGVGISASFLDLASEYASMLALSVVIILLISLRVLADRRDTRRFRVLVIGAHPDDIEIACGAAMARLHDSGHIIWGLVMTCGEQGGNSAVRPDEARSGATFLGLDHLRQLDFPDTRLSERSTDLIAEIEARVREHTPDMIFTHSRHDLHQDHQAVHDATLRAARNSSTIFCYESPSVTQEFVPTFFVDVSEYIDVKIESIKEHWDQRGKPYVQAERVKGTAVFRGGQAKLRYAEAFEVVRASYSSIG